MSLVNIFSYATTNVSTSAYVTLVSSAPLTVSKLQICDTSGELIVIAKGEAGSEVDICTVQISQCIILPIYLEAGERLSAKAITNNATNGYNSISFLNT